MRNKSAMIWMVDCFRRQTIAETYGYKASDACYAIFGINSLNLRGVQKHLWAFKSKSS